MTASNNNQDSHLGSEHDNKVIILGTGTQIGLTLIRELGQRGCHIIGIGRSKDSIGLSSRYTKQRFLWPQADEQQQVEFLNQVAATTGARFLLCISETDILFLNRNRDRLIGVTPLIPSQENIEKVLSKEHTAELAAVMGISSPASHTITSLEQLDGLLPDLDFPVILKWSNPHAVMAKAAAEGISLEKVIYCHSQQQLRDQLSTYQPLEAFPMIQAYCPGYGLGQFFFMHKGAPLLRFQHRRLHEWPPEGGFSSLCASVGLDQHQSLQQQSIELLRQMNWEGPAMVEYRYDEATGHAVLMEINGRFWGSLPLAYYCNVPFGWYSYQVLGLGNIPTEMGVDYKNLRCRNTLIEIKRLIRILFQPQKIKDKSLSFNALEELWEFIGGYFDPRMRYYIFSLSDPKPLLADWLAMAKKILRR
ncbi:MAG: hypothetical protein V7707_02920 [Motiliproteus sp.]